MNFVSKMLTCITIFSITSNAALTDTIHIKPDGEGDRTQGRTAATAIKLDTLPLLTISPGTVFFIWGGTYNAGAGINLSSFDGTRLAPNKFIGVKAATTNSGTSILSSDYVPYGDTAAMPHINMGTSSGYRFTTGDTTGFYGIYFYGDTVGVLTTGNLVTFNNCCLKGTFATSNSRYAFVFNAEITLRGCVVLCPNTKAISCGNDCFFINSIFYGIGDATYGDAITATSTGCLFYNSEFRGCLRGIVLGTNKRNRILKNTFWKNSIDISGSTAFGNNIYDNMSLKSGAFVSMTTKTDYNDIDNNFVDTLKKFVNVDTLSYWRDSNIETGELLIDTTTLLLSDSTSNNNEGVYRSIRTEAP